MTTADLPPCPGRGADGPPGPAVTSLRWWFENRGTGRITVAQFPNWPLFAIGGATLARRLTEPGTTVHDGTGFLIPALWIYWGADELIRGVNPWRRLLGLAAIGWQTARFLIN